MTTIDPPTRQGQEVPLYPAQLTSSPLNLHVHGLHVCPKGNADNVMLHIPAGMSNTYTYHVPRIAARRVLVPQSSAYPDHGANLSRARRAARDRPHGRQSSDRHANRIPIRNMILQYNYVFDRVGGLAQINITLGRNSSTPSSPREATNSPTARTGPARSGQLRGFEKGDAIFHDLVLRPAVDRKRARTLSVSSEQFAAFTAAAATRPKTSRRILSLPDCLRDVQFTVNGQFEPVIRSKAGQTEIWVLANVSDIAYMPVRIDGDGDRPSPEDRDRRPRRHSLSRGPLSVDDNGTKLLIPPASRYAIAVTMPAKGDLVLAMPPIGGGAKTITAPGVLYTNDGTTIPLACSAT